jgi:hypothetical protein
VIVFDTAVPVRRDPERVFAVLSDFGTYLARWAKGHLQLLVRSDQFWLGESGQTEPGVVTARCR